MVIKNPRGRIKSGAKIFRSYFKQFSKTQNACVTSPELLSLDGWCCLLRGPLNWDNDYTLIADTVGEYGAFNIAKIETIFKEKITEALSRGFIVVVGYEQIWATKETNLEEIQAETSQEIFS